jgi:protein gp37
MSQGSKIEWTDATWNPVRGCTRVSEGCRNCYAERMAARQLPGHNSPTTGEPFAVMTDSGPRWTGKVELIEHKLEEPLHWRKPSKVFVNSMSELFHESLPYEAIYKVLAVIALCHWHEFQILTKRGEGMYRIMSDPDTRGRMLDEAWEIAPDKGTETLTSATEWPIPNLHLGVSVEDQETADERIPWLLKTPAAFRFVSYEPALEAVDFAEIGIDEGVLDGLTGDLWVDGLYRPDYLPVLDQVIVGGESGPGARPTHPDWVRKVRDQCQAAGVAFFFKQWGEWMPIFHGINPSENDPKCRIRDGFTFPASNGEEIGQHMWRVGKKAAGRLLDGREWNEIPEVPR